jgi:hypothetical protein
MEKNAAGEFSPPSKVLTGHGLPQALALRAGDNCSHSNRRIESVMTESHRE